MIMFPRIFITTAFLGCAFSAVSCRQKASHARVPKERPATVTRPSTRESEDAGESGKSPQPARSGMEVMSRFRTETRALFNDRKFAELEALAEKIRSGKEQFPGGTWKIHQFYACMDCSSSSPENLWRLHEQIHQDWETQYPKSSTAQIAKARFYNKYAWHARGNGYAKDVNVNGWTLFNERLAQARTTLDQSKSLTPACPMWWASYQSVALGQGWDRAEYDALFSEATKFEPDFFLYDCARATHLLPRWNGEEGEWEEVAEKEIARRGKMGLQIYARVVDDQSSYYGNIFKGSAASWKLTRAGYEEMMVQFPQSAGILNRYCRLAFLAGDRDQTKKLFKLLGSDLDSSSWRKQDLQRAKAWAASED
jgi:hypothetical protein